MTNLDIGKVVLVLIVIYEFAKFIKKGSGKR